MTTTKSLVLCIAVLGLTALSGCDVYFDDRDDDGPSDGNAFCDESGCWYCDEWGCYPDDGAGGWGTCTTDSDCAEGCYCATDGSCVEAGFCGTDSDCPEGFVCDDRASCVPEGDRGGGCESDANCPDGSYCNRDTSTCEPVDTCSSDADCGPDSECDRGTCVPCGDTGCTPDDAGLCYAAPAGCGTEPTCPGGSFAGVNATDGCYSGLCIPESLCPDDPPFACADAADEADCTSHAECESVFIGINCTDPGGASCTEGSADCRCESFEYGLCRDKP